MAVQEPIGARRLKRHVGTVQTVLIDALNPEGAVARSQGDAPEIDGNVFIDASSSISQRARYRETVRVGAFVKVRISGADGHDLWGQLA